MKSDALFAEYQWALERVDRKFTRYAENGDESAVKARQAAREAVFGMYQDLRSRCDDPLPSLRESMRRDRAPEFPPYRFEEGGPDFPCVGVLEYRGRSFPVYDDDYAMSSFAVVDGRTVQVDSFGGETDWYYELDAIIDGMRV